MAHFQSNAQGRQTDEYGNPIRQTTDEYGNPMHRTDAAGTGMGYGNTGGVGADLKDTVKDMIPGLHGHETDEYGNPIHRTGAAPGTGTGYGTGAGAWAGAPTYGGVGTEIKKTMKDMVPGLHGHDQVHRQTNDEYGNPIHRTGAAGTGTGYGTGLGGGNGDVAPTYGGVGTDLKETIKEKVPGLHGHDQAHHVTPTTTATGGYGAPTTTSTGGEGHHEKKGMMEKIKEKLPGHHH